MDYRKEFELEIRLLRMKMFACGMSKELLSERVGMSIEEVNRIFAFDLVPSLIDYFKLKDNIDSFFNLKLMENESDHTV